MSWFLQDALVTALAFGALLILVRRITGAVGPSRGHDGCEKCPSCPGAGRAAQPAPLIQIPTGRGFTRMNAERAHTGRGLARMNADPHAQIPTRLRR